MAGERDVAIRELAGDETGLVGALMADLRPHWPADELVEQVNGRQRPQGYRLVAAFADGAPVAVAGFRVVENLASGRHLYVDDLVTLPDERGRGHGARLMDWLVEAARSEGCGAVHLDCGVQRHDAHRFYFAHGLRIGGYHFERAVGQPAGSDEGRRVR